MVGISADSVASHVRFAERLGGLPFPLLSDVDRETITAYGVLNEKGTGALRSIFVVAEDGRVAYANPRYAVHNPDHFEAIFAALGRLVEQEGRGE